MQTITDLIDTAKYDILGDVSTDESGLVEHVTVEREARRKIAHSENGDDVQFSVSDEYCSICDSRR